MMEFPTQLFGIIGYPLGHSMSPALHNWAFKNANYPGVYLAWPIEEAKLADFFAAARTLKIMGGNITIPHKVAARGFMDKLSERAGKIGAINTFYWREGKLCGENTDVAGFMAPLLDKSFSHALVLGAGGAARAIMAGLRELGVMRITVANRTAQKAIDLARDFDAQAVPWEDRLDVPSDLIVNATALGMQGERVDMTAYPARGFAGKSGLAYDIVYNPPESRFLREAKDNGWQTLNGLPMFVEQARAAFFLWTDREMPYDATMQKVGEWLKDR